MTSNVRSRVVIVGGGFAGLAAAKNLDREKFSVTLIDRQNYHLFQPLLYQVATGSLGATDIATPLRMILKPEVARVVQEEVVGADPDEKHLVMRSGNRYPWDILILAVGLGHCFFGHDEWRKYAPGLKYLDDGFVIRDKIFSAFERAEIAHDRAERDRALRFVIVGGGPTGVELAGAIGEMAGQTLAKQFSSFDPRSANIDLVEAGATILPQYSEAAASEAVRELAKLGVTVRTNTKVTNIDETGLVVTDASNSPQRIDSDSIIWAAGATASTVSLRLLEALDIAVERGGRVAVNVHFQVPDRKDIYVIGDLAISRYDGMVLPGLAPVAEQAGRFVGRYLSGRSRNFEYRDRGQLAVVGRNAAVGVVLGRSVEGVLAWWLWLLVHIREIIGFDVKLKVTVAWIWKFVFDKYTARIITHQTPGNGQDQAARTSSQ